MYQFVTGPLAWLAFGIFFVGCVVRIVLYVKGLNWQMDRVTYGVNISYGVRGALRSIFYWLLPLGTTSWRKNAGFNIVVFIFHFGLLFTPLFLLAHNILLKERWGFGLWSMSEAAADGMTVSVIVTGLILVFRRIAYPEVRIITNAHDRLIMAISIAPFVTGILAHHQIGNYDFWLILHILCGEIFLAAIPFTKLSHFVLFFASRAQLGMDYGIKRGGMKGKGLAW